jgi:hypothetical protein
MFFISICARINLLSSVESLQEHFAEASVKPPDIIILCIFTTAFIADKSSYEVIPVTVQ